MNAHVSIDPTRRTIEGHGGIPINVWDYGGDGPTLILCHCTGTVSRVWDPIIEGLQGSYRVYAPDTRGHGESGKPSELDAYAWSNTGQDLYAMIEQLDLGKGLFAAGHSAGATQIAYCQFQHPGTFSRAVLIDPIIGPQAAFASPSPMGDAARHRKREFDSKEEALENFMSKRPMNTWARACVEAYVTHGFSATDEGHAILKCLPEIEGAIYDRGGAPDLFLRLHELSFDQLTHVSGTESNVKALIDLQRTALSSAKVIDIEGASHFIPQEYPGEVSEILRATFA